jgi:hypothetical protein
MKAGPKTLSPEVVTGALDASQKKDSMTYGADLSCANNLREQSARNTRPACGKSPASK